MVTYARYVALRDKRGLTDADIAKETGIPQSTFSDWKSGKSIPKLPKLIKIAEVFNTSIEELITSD